MEKSEKGTIIIICFLVLMIILIKIALAWIQFNRFLFWFDVVFLLVSFIGIIVSIIFLFREGWDDEDWLIIGGISLGVFLFTILTINGTYNVGYSDEAIKTKADLKEQLESYTLILSIYTGEFRLRVEGMVLNELNKALCEASPETPCEQVIKSYNAYQELIGWKNSADKIVGIWR